MKTKSLRDNLILRLMILFILSLLIENTMADVLPLPVTNSDYHDDGQPNSDEVELGKLLFFDKVLSGNKDISCGTCHNPLFGTGDGISVAIGAGGVGSGPSRLAGTAPFRIVRNSLPLYNMGATEFTTFLVDGGFSISSSGVFNTPFRGSLPTTMNSLLAAQALRPFTVPGEMTGLQGANDITTACTTNAFTCIWNGLVARLNALPEYVDRFNALYADGITIAHVGNAIASYENVAFRSDDSPFDAYLRGDSSAMSAEAITGMDLFYGEAGCSTCHSGKFQTDHSFHAIAMPQIGAALLTVASRRDLGLRRISRLTSDLHKFKTPSLRNVALTSPYGHDGAYSSLEAVVRHHLNPVSALNSYDKTQAILPPFPLIPTVAATDFAEHDNLTQRALRAGTNELAAISLSNDQVNALLAFMDALTGYAVRDVLHNLANIPARVPSGLPVED
ncbi:MAG: cytochrome-c peroxidase [Methylovulum sp.]